MNSFSLVLVLLCVSGSYALPTVLKTETGKPLPKSLISLGTTSDGKEFWVDRETERTWNESRIFCKENGLQFATLDSRIQNNFLVETRNENNLTRYWTSARENRELPQGLVWDDDESMMTRNATVTWWWYGEGPNGFHYCGYFDVLFNGSMNGDYCLLKLGTLCQGSLNGTSIYKPDKKIVHRSKQGH